MTSDSIGPTRLVISRTSSTSEFEPSTLYWAIALDAPTVDLIRKLQRGWQVAHDEAGITFVTWSGWLGTAFELTPEIDALLGPALYAVDNLYPTVIVDLSPELDAALDAAEYTHLSPSYAECDGRGLTLWAFVGDGDTRVTANEILQIDQLALLTGVAALPPIDPVRAQAPHWSYFALDSSASHAASQPEPPSSTALCGYRAARGVLATLPTLDALTVEALRAGVVATRLAIQAAISSHYQHHDTPICLGEQTCQSCAGQLPHYAQGLRLALPLLAAQGFEVLASAHIPLALRMAEPLIDESHLLESVLPPLDQRQWERPEINAVVALVEAARSGIVMEAGDGDLQHADLFSRTRLRLFSSAITTGNRVLKQHGLAARSLDELDAQHANIDESKLLAAIAQL